MDHTYRTKPVAVEAFQITLQTRWVNKDWPKWLHQAWQKDHGEGAIWPNPDRLTNPDYNSADGLVLGVSGGVVYIELDDWIVHDSTGELFVCKPDIFERTYEAIEMVDSIEMENV